MGGFYDSIHAKTESYNLIKDILTELSKSKELKFYLAPVINGWISLFPNNYWQETLACEISRRVVYDDDIFRYLYYRSGELIDEYNSCPDYFGEEVSTKDKKRLKGNPEVFIELVGSKDKVKQLRKILSPALFLDEIQAPDEIKEIDKKFKSLSKSIDSFVNDPNAMLEFLEKNPELFKDEMKSLAEKHKK
jgi:hypothetical protein